MDRFIGMHRSFTFGFPFLPECEQTGKGLYKMVTELGKWNNAKILVRGSTAFGCDAGYFSQGGEGKAGNLGEDPAIFFYRVLFHTRGELLA